MINKENLSQNELTLYSRKEVCKMWKIGISSLDKIPESELPRIHLGKSIRFEKKSLIQYINKKESKNEK